MASRLLYLVRHGEAVGGDGELSGVGRQQAVLTGERLSEVPFATIHHSTLPRAKQTAEEIASRLPGVPVIASELLRECVPSVPAEDVMPAEFADYFTGLSPEFLATDGPDQAAAAVETFAGASASDRRDLIVSHGNLIRWFVCHALSTPPSQWLSMADYHCGVTVILYRTDRSPVLVSYNDVGHLPAELRGIEFKPEWRA